jgi:cytochrome P450
MLTHIPSDTVSIIMTGIIYYLLTHPHYQSKLHQEFEAAERVHADLDSQTLAKLPVLNGIINETLRLHYPGPSGFPRTTPPEGIRIGGTYIPGDVHVKVPIYSVFRDSRSFNRPDEFIPERWSSRKDLVRRPEAFAPFLVGPYNCVGKNLALIQIRRIIYTIVREFELQPSQEGLLEYDGQQRDGFNMGLGPLITAFKQRSRSE